MTHHTGHNASNRTGLGNSDVNDTTGRQSILSMVREGMDVYDVKDDRIGSVDFVHFGAASETQQELGTGPASPARGSASSRQSAYDPADMNGCA